MPQTTEYSASAGIYPSAPKPVSHSAVSYTHLGALLNAIPGIVVQLILVPAVVVALQKAKLIEAPSAEKA